MRAVALLGDAAAEGANAETPGATAAAAANRAREDAKSFIWLVDVPDGLELYLLCGGGLTGIRNGTQVHRSLKTKGRSCGTSCACGTKLAVAQSGQSSLC